jgi:hypothetical protein
LRCRRINRRFSSSVTSTDRAGGRLPLKNVIAGSDVITLCI